ncbi:hypothetical protein RBE51_19135 [Pseudomonas taiwanensis]|nr:hypothetical protein [Pseudomonas taiwanensis]
MITGRTLRDKAIDSFGLAEAGIALIALDQLMKFAGLGEDDDTVKVFEAEDWDAVTDAVVSSLNGKGSQSELAAIQAKLMVWRMVYRLEKLSGHHLPSEPEPVEPTEPQPTRAAYAPVDLGSTFLRGCLYYPVQTLVSMPHVVDGIAQTGSESIDVVVVRSDRTLLNVIEAKPAKGRQSHICRLTDGTLLQKPPIAGFQSTWSWDSIQRYLANDYTPQSLRHLARRVYQHLHAKVWLPDPDDYWVLTFSCITSYVQAIFDAVPLILLNGEGGTGKSDLGKAMTDVSCNAVMIGKTSPSSMIRLMDEAKGLVVIDDLESIGVRASGGGRESFSEMVQVLKVSYKKASANKVITNDRKKTEIVNFFGVKIVSNTTGVDRILGTRMIQISTQLIPKDQLDPFLARHELSSDELHTLRNELHCWAFDHVNEISNGYRDLFGASADREQEIAAPLRVLAKLSGLTDAQQAIERSLEKQTERKITFRSATDALAHVIEQCAREGARTISVVEVMLKLRQAMGQKPVKSKPLVWMKPEWVSKKLRELGWVTASAGRKNLYGYQMRILGISDDKRLEVGALTKETRPYDAFCKGCLECPFRNYGCEIMPYRVKREGL